MSTTIQSRRVGNTVRTSGMKFDDLPDVLMVGEVAKYLRLSTRMIYRLIEEGTLKASRHGRAVRILKVELETYLAAT